MTTTPSEQAVTPSRAKLAGAVAIAVACGGLVAVQSRINGELGHELDNGFVAAIISFGSGLVLLSLALPFSRRARSGLARVRGALGRRDIPWWYVAGGVAGALFVLGQGLTIGALGVALFTVAVVGGQIVSGLLIDARGIGSTPPRVISPWRFIGAGLAITAVGIAVSPEFAASDTPWMLVFPVIVGLVLSWQMAVNGQVKAVAGAAISATYVNMLGGTAFLLVVTAVAAAVDGWPARFPGNPWLYTGGAIAMVFITGFAAVIRITGVLVQGLAALAGQLLVSLAIDVVAPAGDSSLAWSTVAGTALTLVAVVLATLEGRARRTARAR